MEPAFPGLFGTAQAIIGLRTVYVKIEKVTAKRIRTEPLPSTARSKLMARIREKNTSPELTVRSVLYGLGYRYRLHRVDLAGTPDIVFPGRQKLIFVHGCFWHQHPGCNRASRPKTRKQFWQAKFKGNVARDSRNVAELRAKKWGVLILWECETRDKGQLTKRLRRFLGPPSNRALKVI